jgi:hypothetical protein
LIKHKQTKGSAVQLGSRGSRIRCLVVWTVASGGLALTGALTGAVLGSAPHGLPDLARTPLDLALTDLAALALLGCAGWLWLVTTVVVTGVLRGGVAGPGPHGVPAGVRRVVLVACGVALVGGLTQPSQAAGPHSHSTHRGHLTALAGLPLPDRAVADAPSRSPIEHLRSEPERTVLVRPGDSLWSLATRDLPAGSPAPLVAERWHAIYAANRSLIGPDPDVIVPGQRLRLPGKDPS